MSRDVSDREFLTLALADAVVWALQAEANGNPQPALHHTVNAWWVALEEERAEGER